MGIYSVMFYGGLVLSILFLIASIIIFFVMKIPHAFGIVTGRSQKKAIEEIRAGGMPRKTKRKVKESDILVRDVDVSGMSSAPLKSDKSGAKMEEARKRAEADARAAAEKAASEKMSQPPKPEVNLEEQATDVLTYNDMKNKSKSTPTGEETTSVLDEENATDVLKTSPVGGYGSSENSDEISDSSRTARGTSVATPSRENVPVDEEAATDVLRNKPKGNIVPDADVTDVLISPNIGLDSNNKDIYGTVSPETTSVLRAEYMMGADSVRPSGKRVLPEITVIYSETVVHTDESL